MNSYFLTEYRDYAAEPQYIYTITPACAGRNQGSARSAGSYFLSSKTALDIISLLFLRIFKLIV